MTEEYMSDEDFQGILDALEEVKTHIKTGEIPNGWRIHTPEMIELRRVRKSLNMTQKEFADTFGFSVRTIGEWEQGRRKPEASARILLKLIEKEPEMVLRTLRAA
jgi:putative transcriptional regulator